MLFVCFVIDFIKVNYYLDAAWFYAVLHEIFECQIFPINIDVLGNFSACLVSINELNGAASVGLKSRIIEVLAAWLYKHPNTKGSSDKVRSIAELHIPIVYHA